MRIAICLSGAMSKENSSIYTKGALYNDAPYVDFYACYNSIKKHILQVNSEHIFDFFIHSWNFDLKEDLEKLYCPKKSLFEDNSLYNNEISSKIKQPNDFSAVSKSLSMKKSLQILEDYQNEYIVKYDLVIIYRPDIFLIKDIDLNSYDKNSIYVNAMEGSCQADFHFIMNSFNAKKFKYLYDSLDKGNVPCVHFWIKKYVNDFMKESLIEDNIEAGKDQEVLRKIYSKENLTISIDIVSQYKYNEIK